MTFNNYVTLDSKKYKTNSNNWIEVEISPRQLKRLLSSHGDATFGINSFRSWEGEMMINVTPATDYGSIDDFMTTFRKKTSLSFTDHYGATYTVLLGGTMRKRSVLPVWNGASNEFYIPVELATL